MRHVNDYFFCRRIKDFVHIILLLFLFVACSESDDMDLSEGSQKPVGLIDMEIKASCPQLSDFIEGDFEEIKWSKDDAVGVFDLSGKLYKLLTNGSEATSTSVFSGKVADSKNYFAFYPYEASLVYKGGLVTINVPDIQKTDDYGTLKMYGPLFCGFSNEDKDIKFKPMCKILSFTISGDDISNIVRAYVQGNSDEYLGGDFNFNVKEGVSTSTLESKDRVNLYGSFQAGIKYYISVASTENLFKNGFKIIFADNTGNFYKKEFNSISTESTVIDLGEIKIGEFSSLYAKEELILPGKKGVCANVNKVIELGGYWNYTWGRTFPEGQPENTEFIPMTWSGFDPKIAITEIQTLVDEGKVKKLLGFNEPDKKDQANMTVDRAIELWPYMETLDVPLGSPATAADPRSSEWFKEFMDRAMKLGYRVDFICLHHYGGNGVSALTKKIEDLYKKYHRPVLVTEFAVADWQAGSHGGNKFTVAQVKNFMIGALDWMEKADYVMGYAWFPFGQDNLAGCTSALYDRSNNLTELGQYYAQFNSKEELPDQETDYYVEYSSESKISFPNYYSTYDVSTSRGKVFFESPEIPNNLFKGLGTVKEIFIPNTITSIGESAFESSSISSVTFEDESELESIIQKAFYNCKSLKEIIIPASVTNISTKVFQGASSLEKIEIPEDSKLEIFGWTAAMGCNSIKNKIVFPSSLTTIGADAFPEVADLEIEFRSSNPPTLGTSQKSFVNGYLKTIYIPAGSLENYSTFWGEKYPSLWAKIKEKIEEI